MKRRWPWLALGASTLWVSLACESEVTFHLLSHGAAVGATADAGHDGASQAGEGGAADVTDAGAESAGVSGDSASSAGSDAGAVDLPPCQKLGPEVCNGGDDDCNGQIDEGCEYTVTWTRGADSNALGHVTGGVMFFEPCPDGSVLTGLHVGMGNWLNQVSAVCRQLALHADTTQNPVLFSVTLGPRLDTPLAPAASTDAKNQVQDLLCPDGLILTGIDGASTTDTAHYILGIAVTCAPPVVITLASGPVLDSDATQQKTSGPLVCVSCTATQSDNFTATVSAGHVTTSIFGGDGLWVDRVGFGASLGTITSQ
jgi:hypothetical protein